MFKCGASNPDYAVISRWKLLSPYFRGRKRGKEKENVGRSLGDNNCASITGEKRERGQQPSKPHQNGQLPAAATAAPHVFPVWKYPWTDISIQQNISFMAAFHNLP